MGTVVISPRQALLLGVREIPRSENIPCVLKRDLAVGLQIDQWRKPKAVPYKVGALYKAALHVVGLGIQQRGQKEAKSQRKAAAKGKRRGKTKGKRKGKAEGIRKGKAEGNGNGQKRGDGWFQLFKPDPLCFQYLPDQKQSTFWELSAGPITPRNSGQIDREAPIDHPRKSNRPH